MERRATGKRTHLCRKFEVSKCLTAEISRNLEYTIFVADALWYDGSEERDEEGRGWCVFRG